jgi:hypothetical protein
VDSGFLTGWCCSGTFSLSLKALLESTILGFLKYLLSKKERVYIHSHIYLILSSKKRCNCVPRNTISKCLCFNSLDSP